MGDYVWCSNHGVRWCIVYSLNLFSVSGQFPNRRNEQLFRNICGGAILGSQLDGNSFYSCRLEHPRWAIVNIDPSGLQLKLKMKQIRISHSAHLNRKESIDSNLYIGWLSIERREINEWFDFRHCFDAYRVIHNGRSRMESSEIRFSLNEWLNTRIILFHTLCNALNSLSNSSLDRDFTSVERSIVHGRRASLANSHGCTDWASWSNWKNLGRRLVG